MDLNKIKSKLYDKKEFDLKDIINLGKKQSLPVNIIKYYDFPFEYGELVNFLNIETKNNWNVILVPSSTYDNKSLLISGYIKFNDGNIFLIMSNNGNITEDDKIFIRDYFKDIKIIFFNKEDLEEEWEQKLLGKYKLGHFKDKDTQGIAVGNSARKYFGAHKIINNLYKT